jgi:hypothetical protein
MCKIGGTLDDRVRTRTDKKRYAEGYADPDRNFGRESRCVCHYLGNVNRVQHNNYSLRHMVVE